MKFLTPLTPILTLLGLTIVRKNVEIGCSAAVKNGTFNNPNCIIYFTGNPLPSKDLVINDVEDFFPMIEKISSEFSQICCTSKHIPIAVATRNKIMSLKNTSYENPLGVYLQHSIKTKKENTTFVENMVELADETNNIFPGTVKYLLCDYDDGSSFDEDDFIRHWSLSETRRRFVSDSNCTKHKYKLGIVFPLDNCKTILKVNYTLSNYVHLVAFFSPIIVKSKNNLTLDESFGQLTKQFEYCADAVKSINPEVELLFQTGIADIYPNSKQHDYLALITFWEMVNDWAIATNVKVIMFEAFDSPDQATLGGTRGLWKLARTPKRYHIPVDFIFMDKRLGNFSISERANTAANNHEVKSMLQFKCGASWQEQEGKLGRRSSRKKFRARWQEGDSLQENWQEETASTSNFDF